MLNVVNKHLVLRYFFVDMERCLEFNYLMYGADLGTLKVKVNGAEVFTISGHHPQQWYTEKIDMPIPLTTVNIFGLYNDKFNEIYNFLVLKS